MKLEPFDEGDGYRVWLSDNEQEMLPKYYDENIEEQLEMRLMLHGLRSDEVNDVCFKNIRQMDVEKEGYMLEIEDGKTGWRECPISADTAKLAKMIKNFKEIRKNEPLIDVSKRTIQRHVTRACEDLADRPNEPNEWKYVTAHDLRRSWATHTYWSIEGDRAREVVMEWGGWSDVQTFSQNYLGQVPDSIAIDVMAEADLI